MKDPGSLDIVGSGERKHDGKTYRVIFGKPKGGGKSIEQAYRYPKSTWTPAQARAHCSSHGGAFEQAGGVDPCTDCDAIELSFWAAVHSIETGLEKRLATFYIMNTSLNLNKWRVTKESMAQALPSLLGKPLNCIPGYRVNHVHKPKQVGRWIRVDHPDGYALATAEITDDVAWEKLSKGEWGPVSVSILAFRVKCSKCGEDISGVPCEHIKDGSGHEIIESFKFKSIDFVSNPAYPQADLVELVMASVSQSTDGRGPGSLRRSLETRRRDEKKLTPEELQAKVNELTAENERIAGELETANAKVTELEAARPDEDPKDEPTEREKELENRLAGIEKERHDALLEEAVDARFKAGLCTDKAAELEALKELPGATLTILTLDAEKVAENLKKIQPTGPKSRYTEPLTDFEAALEASRETMYGHKRDTSGGVV